MRNIIISGSFLLALLCLSVFIFDPTNLYYELPWLDIPMHVLGGAGVASFAMAVAIYGKQKLSLLHVIILYLCVALAWEFYELCKDLLQMTEWNGWYDTLSDIINGGIGAVAAFFLFKK